MQRADGSEWLSGDGRYANLRSSGVATTIEPGFYVYEPEVLAERLSHAEALVTPPAIEDDGSTFARAFLRRGVVPEITAVSSVVDRIRKRIEEGTSNSEWAQKLQKSTGRDDEQDIHVQQHGCKRDGVDAALAQFLIQLVD